MEPENRPNILKIRESKYDGKIFWRGRLLSESELRAIRPREVWYRPGPLDGLRFFGGVLMTEEAFQSCVSEIVHDEVSAAFYIRCRIDVEAIERAGLADEFRRRVGGEDE